MPRWAAILALTTAIFAIGSETSVRSGLVRTTDQAVHTKGFQPPKALVRTQGAALNERSGASTADPVVGTVANGSAVSVACQRFGQQIVGAVSNTPWWVQLTDGRFVAEGFLKWPAARPSLPWCSATALFGVFPTASTTGGDLNVRSGPHLTSPVVTTVPDRSEIKVSCQVWSETVAGTQGESAAWNQLTDGTWVADAYVRWRPSRPKLPWCGQMPATVPPGGAAAFIAMAVGPAQESMRTDKVPASVTIAQAILESGWGRSSLNRVDHNYFGMKCFGSPGPIALGCRYYGTYECDSSGCFKMSDTFRAYRNDADSYRDHGQALATLPRYRPAFAYTSNPDQFAREIHKAGYATDPTYADELISLMRKYNLYQYDKP
jgi:flagellar protein FlgJ